MLETTEDNILNGKIRLFQPKNGYRVAVDPIILASLVALRPCHKVLDVGCGSGAISLILKLKEKAAEITAIDMDDEMCQICQRNGQANFLDLEIITTEVGSFSDPLKNRFFDVVVTNPPFFSAQSFRPSNAKRFANFETLDLLHWISYCLRKLKNNGVFYIIHCATRIGDILEVLNKIGSVEIMPLFPKEGMEAKRVIIKCKKNHKSGAKILPGLCMHRADGCYSADLSDILKGNFLPSLQQETAI
ncbi:MAG: methyltransferase [Holosporaceae bacterium]|jgi:tRNA1(Val) A37 N6-methylase TrmN6|nr:methyltransferase [Holosporaceae bacterium]